MNDVAIVDDVSAFAAALRRPTPPQGPIVIEMDIEAMADQARGDALERAAA
jgi:hypothetical protein